MNKFAPPITNNNHLEKFLSGDHFSNLEKFRFDKRAYIYYRLDLLDHLLKDKTVLHFGCCDHENLIEEKISDNSHLQVRLSGITRKCTGIDNNMPGLNKLKELGIGNCHYYDLFTSKNDALEKEQYDYVLLGEILEHIADPSAFLKMIRTKFIHAGEIIITVPNAFSSKNFYNIKRGFEEINTDHKYWFTPYTLSKVARESGFKMKSIYFVDRSRLSIPDKIIKWFFLAIGQNPFTARKWSIYKSTGLVAICSFH
jgi:2-polyprenyl-3-methyl-5-hydroxy-6-metoxy-1,4-benzoquinol methylase